MQTLSNFRTAYNELISALYLYYRLPTEEKNVNIMTNYLIAALQGEVNTFSSIHIHDKTRLLACYLFTLYEVKLDTDSGTPTVMKNSLAARYNIFRKDILELLEDMRLFDIITIMVVILNCINILYNLGRVEKIENIFLQLPRGITRLTYNTRYIRGKKKTFGGMRVDAAQVIPSSSSGRSARESRNPALDNVEKNTFISEFNRQEPPLIPLDVPLQTKVEIPLPEPVIPKNPPPPIFIRTDINPTIPPPLIFIQTDINTTIEEKECLLPLQQKADVEMGEMHPLPPTIEPNTPVVLPPIPNLVVTANGEEIPNKIDGSTPLYVDAIETNLHTVVTKHKGNYVRVLIKEGQRNGQFCLVSKYFMPSTEKNSSMVRFNKGDVSMKWSTRIRINKEDLSA